MFKEVADVAHQNGQFCPSNVQRVSARFLNIWNISPAVDEHSAVFCGDVVYLQEMLFSLSLDCLVNVNCITQSLHGGAHADAPAFTAASKQQLVWSTCSLATDRPVLPIARTAARG